MFVGGGVAYKAIALGPQVEWEICNQGGNCSDCSCYNWNIPDRVLNKSPSGYCRQFTVTVNLRFSSFCEADIVRLHFPMGKLRNGEVKKLLALSWSLLLFSEWLIISLNTQKVWSSDKVCWNWKLARLIYMTANIWFDPWYVCLMIQCSWLLTTCEVKEKDELSMSPRFLFLVVGSMMMPIT